MRQVTDGRRVVACRNGVPLLTKITAAGCAVTALAAAFISCAPDDPLMATAHALAVFGYGARPIAVCRPYVISRVQTAPPGCCVL